MFKAPSSKQVCITECSSLLSCSCTSHSHLKQSFVCVFVRAYTRACMCVPVCVCIACTCACEYVYSNIKKHSMHVLQSGLCANVTHQFLSLYDLGFKVYAQQFFYSYFSVAK